MTTRGSEAAQEAIAFGGDGAPFQGAERACARETPQTASPIASPPDAAAAGRAAAGAVLAAAARASGLLPRLMPPGPGYRPASIAQSRAAHHEAAARWDMPLLAWGRLCWGYLVHLPGKWAVFLLDWALESFPKCAAAALVVYVAWHWI